MRKQLILAALAGFVGLSVCGASVSAYDHSYEYRERWYKAYERNREARDERRERAEGRAYERYRDRYYDDDGYYGRRNHYRSYAYGPRYRHYSDYDDDYGYGGYDYYSSASRYGYPRYTDRPQGPYEWKSDEYPAGWNTWWKQMDRDGRGGQQ